MAGIADAGTYGGSIRTPDQRLRVFISSTLGELAPERVVVGDVVRRLRLAPVMFELAARAHPPRQLYRSYLAQSDVFVGIYWERYGWTAPDMEISGLEDEYRLSGDMPRLLYVKEPAEDRDPQLTVLLDDMVAGATPPRVFSTPQELADLVANDLAMLLSARFTSGSVEAVATRAPAPAAATSLHPLPVPPTPLVEREQEVAIARDLLLREDVRLVTLSGPGGIGKSRIAVEVASQVAPVYDGVCFVGLSAIDDAELVVPAIATALGLPGEGSRSQLERVTEALCAQRTLLVLDNFEHVLAAAPVVSVLLAQCPLLTVLVTSRAVLRLHGEWEQPVPPLRSRAGAELFAQRAQEARPGLQLTEEDRRIAQEISARLDGLPLAIELAAARTRLLPPAALLKRLERGLDVLASGPADLPERQRTLQATIEWSYTLLPSAERRLLQRLSVFAGGWSLEAAEQVCADDEVPDVLTSLSVLLEHSLIQLDSSGSEPRFRLLATIREYAALRLAESGDEATGDRHADWIQRLAKDAELKLRGRQVRTWTQRLESEMDNIRAAVRWLIDHDERQRVIELTWGIILYLWSSDHLMESRRWLDFARGSTAELDDTHLAQLALLWGITTYEHGEYEEARVALEDAYARFDALDDPVGRPSTLVILGAVQPHFGEVEAAERHLQQAAAELRATGNVWGLTLALSLLTVLVARRGDVDGALVLAAEALTLSRQLRNRVLGAQALVHVGYLTLIRGDRKRARGLLHDAADMFRNLRHREGFANCLDAQAALALADRDLERAALLLGGADGLRHAIGAHIWPLLSVERDPIVQSVQRRMGDEAFQEAYARGRNMSHIQLLEVALRPAVTPARL